MDIGVVLQTTPPASRVIDLARRAESYGFSHVWTFDSHILWEEPYVIYSKILDETRNVIVGPMVTNPATRDITVTASVFATLNEMYGNRTVIGIGRGDSAVRVTNGKPVSVGELRQAVVDLKGLVNGESIEYNGNTLRLPWASKSRAAVMVAAYGPKVLALTGEVGDGFILQLADPSIAEWTIKAVRDAAAAAGRNPDDVYICVAARPTSQMAHPKATPMPATSCAGLAAWSAITSPISSNATAQMAAPCPRPLPNTSSTARATTTTSMAVPATRIPTSCPTRSSTASASSARPRSTFAASRSSRHSAYTNSPCTSSMTTRITPLSNTAGR